MIPAPVETTATSRTGRWIGSLGIGLSILLHLLVGALFLGHWGLTTRHEPAPERIITVETVRLEPPKPEPPKPEPPKAEVPKPEPPPEPPQQQTAKEELARPVRPPPPPPQLQPGKLAEKSTAPKRAPPSPPPPPKEEPHPVGIAPPQDWAANYRSRDWVEATLDKVGPVAQSEHDYLLAQILKMWRPNPSGFPAERIREASFRILILPNGELGGLMNKNERWRPQDVITGYASMPPDLRRTAESFLMALRLAQPLQLPPHQAGYWPRRMEFRFSVADVMPR
jgi:hypothetical protein